MDTNELRTYRRRQTTRESGYHTCEETTGGECIIAYAQRLTQVKEEITLEFFRESIYLTSLFDKDIGILSFGGYLFTDYDVSIRFSFSYTIQGYRYSYEKDFISPIIPNSWNNIGVHKEISLDNGELITDATLKMSITGRKGNNLEFICFDFNSISKSEFESEELETSFYQKTAMHIPYLYYLDTQLPLDKYLANELPLERGRRVVLKSCNRCGRFLPINMDDEVNTLSFSLHCKKRAPCVHSTFRAYTVLNSNSIEQKDYKDLNIENGKVVSYFGHQLECKACKKFFVNAPLNPQRNPQQFKEDGLRRRAIEVLVNELLHRNLVHFEFEQRTKKQFAEYIWKKFGQRCFKCNRKIMLDEMHLDHTMPLAYLYRLDETATCLCGTHNSQKRDHFPAEYYTAEELVRLSTITGMSIETLHLKEINQEVLALLVKNIVWYFDEFLMRPDYQKIRDGILTADKINDSLKRVIAGKVSLSEEYRKCVGSYPTSVSI